MLNERQRKFFSLALFLFCLVLAPAWAVETPKGVYAFGKWIDTIQAIEDDFDRVINIRSLLSQLVISNLDEQRGPLFERLFKVAGQIQDPGQRGDAFIHIATALAEAGLLAKGDLSESLIRFAGQSGDSLSRVEVFSRMAPILLGVEKKEEGIALFQEGIRLAEKVQNGNERAFALRSILSGLDSSGLWKESKPLLDRIHLVAETINEPGEKIDLLRELASQFLLLGFKEEGLALFREAIHAANRIEESEARGLKLVGVSFNLAHADLKGDLLPVLDLLIRSAEKIPDPLPKAYTLSKISHNLSLAGFQKEMTPVFQKAVVSAEKIENPFDREALLREIRERKETAY